MQSKEGYKAFPDLQRIAELEAENAALRERLAAAEQREQQARAIIEAVAELDVQVLTTTDRKTYLRTLTGIHDVQQIHDQARAWLADRAEQRAVERFGDTQSWRPDALHRDILAAGERIGTEQEASE